MFRLLIVLFIPFALGNPAVLWEALNKIPKLIELAKKADSFMDTIKEKEDEPTRQFNEVISSMNSIASSIHTIGNNMNHHFEGIQYTLRQQHVSQNVKEAQQLQKQIERHFNFIKPNTFYENYTLKKFADDKHFENVQEYHEQYFEMFGKPPESTLQKLVLLLKEDARMELSCDSQMKSVHLQVLDMFPSILMVELKGNIVVYLKYIIWRLLGKGDFKDEIEIFRKNWQKRQDNAKEVFRSTFKMLDDFEYNRCYKNFSNKDLWTSFGVVEKISKGFGPGPRGSYDCAKGMCYIAKYEPDTISRFVLRPVSSDVKNNFVITGVKFAEKDGCIYIEIETGELLPFGRINESSVSWINVNSTWNLDNEDFFKYPNEYIRVSGGESKTKAFIGNIRQSGDFALTSVRFTTDSFHSDLLVEATFHKFDYFSGKLSDHSVTKGQATNHLYSNWMDTSNLDSPLRSQPVNIITDKEGVLLFNPTAISKKGVSVVPYIDTQKIESVNNLRTPLSGFGLVHQHAPGYGGFISPNVFLYDHRNHLREIIEKIFNFGY